MSKALYLITLHHRQTILLNCNNPLLHRFFSEHGQSTKTGSGGWRRFLHTWTLIPTGIGVTVLGVLQWRRLQRDRDGQPPVSLTKELEITCYRSLPLRIWSRTWGFLSNRQIPSPMRSWVYSLYSKVCGVNLDEVAGNLKDYPSLSKFFTRALKPGARPIASSELVSPADGTVVNFGKISSCYVEQIKGATYKIQTLFGDLTWLPSKTSSKKNNDDWTGEITKTDENENFVKNKSEEKNHSTLDKSDKGRRDEKQVGGLSMESKNSTVSADWKDYRMKLLTNSNNELYQVIVYLSPGDYHRFHSPAQWQVNFRRHFQGELLSVNPMVVGWVPGLFSLNERVVYFGKWKHGFFSMTIVGATSVGSIKVHSDEALETNTRKWRDGTTHKDKTMNCSWKKGEEVGEFNMGSTIILIFEAPKDCKFKVETKQHVNYGQTLTNCD